MNGFIDEVVTQGTLMQEVGRYYRGAGLQSIQAIVAAYQERGCNQVILSGMGSSLYAMDSVRSFLTSNGIPALAFSSFELSRFQFGHVTDKTLLVAVSQSGKSMEETVPKVRGAADVTIKGLMVSLNRMEVGKGGKKCALDEIRDFYGFETAAIVTMEEVVEYLYDRECQGKIVIDDTLKSAIDAYYEQYGVK